MRTTADALRSLKRYASQVLGGEWEVRLDRESGMVTLPHARVTKVGPTLFSGPKYEAMLSQPMSLFCTPAPGRTGEEAQQIALDIEEAIFQGFLIGVGKGHPMRVPLYDYDGIDYATAAEENDRSYCDYMRVTELSIAQIADPDDERRIAVTVDLRLTWRRRASIPPHLHNVETVTVTPTDL